MMTPFISGLGLSASLIVAIGAQNAFVLSQSMKRQFYITVTLICIAAEILLITAGVMGLGTLVQNSTLAMDILLWGGAGYLLWMGYGSFKRATKPEALVAANGIGQVTRNAIIMKTLAVTFLNPHVYLDTVVLVGSVGAQFPAEYRWLFALGAVCASIFWFAVLAIGGSKLAPYVARPRTWQIIEIATGSVMVMIAAGLVISAL